MTNVVDPELKAIHIAVHNLYNRETTFIQSNPTSTASINGTNFLARQAILFADAALYLMEDVRQPINAAAALLRTCLEAQARANHIIAVTGEEREQRAGEFLQLMNVGHEYFETLGIQMTKDFAPDVSNTLPRDLPYLAALKPLVDKCDTSNLKELKSQYKTLRDNWRYDIIIGRGRLDPAWQNRSDAQRLQPELDYRFITMCAFVHSDPASLKLAPTPLSVAYIAVTAEVVAVSCFFVALGKEKDQDLLNLTKSLKAFNVNEKTLPSNDLINQLFPSPPATPSKP